MALHHRLLSLLLVALLPLAVRACIRVHTMHTQQPWPEGDGLHIEIWDNDETYYRCPGCTWQSFSDQTCKVTCEQFELEIGEYGRSGRVTNTNNGYTAELSVKTGAKPISYCCLIGFKGECRGNCQAWEYCLTDEFENCGRYACRLCGGKPVCGVRDKRELEEGGGVEGIEAF